MKNIKPQGNCKICDKYKVFVKSHLIPKGLISHTHLPMNKKGIKIYAYTNKRGTLEPQVRPNTLHDYFLCIQCEELFKDLDDYLCKFIKEPRKYWQKVDLELLEIACASMLLRLSLASDNISDVDLGDLYNNHAKNLIIKYNKKEDVAQELGIFYTCLYYNSCKEREICKNVLVIPTKKSRYHNYVNRRKFYYLCLPGQIDCCITLSVNNIALNLAEREDYKQLWQKYKGLPVINNNFSPLLDIIKLIK